MSRLDSVIIIAYIFKNVYFDLYIFVMLLIYNLFIDRFVDCLFRNLISHNLFQLKNF